MRKLPEGFQQKFSSVVEIEASLLQLWGAIKDPNCPEMLGKRKKSYILREVTDEEVEKLSLTAAHLLCAEEDKPRGKNAYSVIIFTCNKSEYGKGNKADYAEGKKSLQTQLRLYFFLREVRLAEPKPSPTPSSKKKKTKVRPKPDNRSGTDPDSCRGGRWNGIRYY